MNSRYAADFKKLLPRSGAIQNLLYITQDLPGIGGSIKAEPEHFIVEEIPLYDAAGEGDHLYVQIERKGWNTKDLARELAGILNQKESDVGFAGLKDKNAVAIQTFSFYLPSGSPEMAADLIEKSLPVKVRGAKRHKNKLKTGHLLGNRFRIILSNPDNDDLSAAREIAGAIQNRGLPNYYGEQRFGTEGDNALRGREILEGKGPRQKWIRKLLLSAFQSQLFNEWLSERIARNWFNLVLAGDIAKKSDTGGIFEVEDAREAMERFESGAITYTGPIYGKKMKACHGEPGELEAYILEKNGVTGDMFQKAKLDGSRRPARLLLPAIRIDECESGVQFDFVLPKGSYATILLREFTKNEEAVDG